MKIESSRRGFKARAKNEERQPSLFGRVGSLSLSLTCQSVEHGAHALASRMDFYGA